MHTKNEGKSNHLLLPLVLNGISVFMIIDTGSSHSVIDHDFADKHLCKIQKSEFSLIKSKDGQSYIPVCEYNTLSIDGHELGSGSFFTIRLDELISDSFENTQVAGILGNDFLIKHEAFINMKNLELEISVF